MYMQVGSTPCTTLKTQTPFQESYIKHLPRFIFLSFNARKRLSKFQINCSKHLISTLQIKRRLHNYAQGIFSTHVKYILNIFNPHQRQKHTEITNYMSYYLFILLHLNATHIYVLDLIKRA